MLKAHKMIQKFDIFDHFFTQYERMHHNYNQKYVAREPAYAIIFCAILKL